MFNKGGEMCYLKMISAIGFVILSGCTSSMSSACKDQATPENCATAQPEDGSLCEWNQSLGACVKGTKSTTCDAQKTQEECEAARSADGNPCVWERSEADGVCLQQPTKPNGASNDTTSDSNTSNAENPLLQANNDSDNNNRNLNNNNKGSRNDSDNGNDNNVNRNNNSHRNNNNINRNNNRNNNHNPAWPTDREVPILPAAVADAKDEPVLDQKGAYAARINRNNYNFVNGNVDLNARNLRNFNQPSVRLASVTWGQNNAKRLELVHGSITKAPPPPPAANPVAAPANPVANNSTLIVTNAANGGLAGGGGVDGAIKAAAGNLPYAPLGDAGAYLRNRGLARVPPGSVVMTIPGNLGQAGNANNIGANYIAHAVGPSIGNRAAPTPAERAQFRTTIRNLMMKCDQYHNNRAVHVMIPAISMGRFNANPDWAIPTLIEEVIREMNRHGSHVQAVSFIVLNDGVAPMLTQNALQKFRDIFERPAAAV
ncbi:MAG: macro domain-containing protein [Myxococcota bacterium]